MPLRLVTYNILADAYIRRSWYPRCTDEALEPARRRQALCEHVAGLGAAVVCMQEVEGRALEALASRLSSAGYRYGYARKGGGKPDGCATFYDPAALGLIEEQRLTYGDGSGHVALIMRFDRAGDPLTVANTHVRWSPPETPLEDSHGYRQLGELAAALGDAERAVVCGDFNLEPEAAALDLLRAAGLVDVHAAAAGPGYTCNPNGEAKRIDFVFAGAALAATPVAVPVIDDHTPLPSLEQPSDHLAVGVELEWRRDPS
jgi:endonuclease/exonuclease/phosphatase family metal-dependent hydrolase